MSLIRRITSDDRVVIRGTAYRGCSSDEVGHVLVRLDPSGVEETFTQAAFDQETRHPDYQFDRAYFAPGRARARLAAGVDSLAHLPPKVVSTVLYRMEYCKRFMKLQAAGEATLSDDSLELVLPKIHAEVLPLDAARLTPPSDDAKPRSRRAGGRSARRHPGAKPGRSRAGRKRVVRDAPGPKTFRRWLKRWRSASFDPVALRDRTYRSGNRSPQIEPEVLLLLRKIACNYATEKRPTKRQLHRDLVRAVGDLNKTRRKQGLEDLRAPSRGALAKAIGELDAFTVMAGREGFDKASAHYAIVTQGPDVVRPLQRVEMDEWTISLMKLAVDAGVWETLSPEERADVQRKRWHLCVAIDVATRCILGASLRPTACVENALACARMMVSDKSLYATSVGAASPWDMHGTVEELVTDSGPSFIAEEFQAAIVAMGTTTDMPPAGLAHLRGYVERSFLTTRLQFVSRFTGQTFANVGEKGDYDPQARASATTVDWAQALIRWWVDCYHLQPHEGLGGETPAAAWRRLTKLVGVIPAPDKHTLRAIFGARLTRTVGKRGLRILGLHYQGETLQAYRRRLGDVAVELRVDPEDLGAISWWDGQAWVTASCTTPDMGGVAVQTWVGALADLRRRFADEARMSLPVVHAAVQAIETLADAAARRARLDVRMPTAEEVEQAERSLVLGYSVPDAVPAEPGPARDGDFFSDGFDTGGANAAMPEAATPEEPAPAKPAPRRLTWED